MKLHDQACRYNRGRLCAGSQPIFLSRTMLPWLRFATAPSTLDDSDIQVIDQATFDVNPIEPALSMVFHCAKSALLSPTNLPVFTLSFKDSIILPRDIETLFNNIMIFVFHDPAGDDDHHPTSSAYHISTPSLSRYSNIPAGNMVKNLPHGHTYIWSSLDRRRVIYASWILTHVLAHALETMLSLRSDVVNQYDMLRRASASRVPNPVLLQLSDCVTIQSGHFDIERGCRVEDRLGGILGFLVCGIYSFRCHA
ncbi:hypothetical protein P691DRAFT_773541 [Macrolepiota fuliginosa MF-IS2]|uniref:Uncharacterized protein n=1 Tax=Macrolepiota fuliginosa MF-IS2 TaxID=1400762 RepID=A0A9P6C766_9AGAR|nr:hypothetical protein P691DRAFT_773541 [Macrolepiota fuliginosa MF-IS2]